mmetsp:Transcript_5028/g.8244  ORF Transcript_5028/g.8244 Transcript_5028/m.8244 type:complete len:259 (-) Transcript_5028:656-1432(-)
MDHQLWILLRYSKNQPCRNEVRGTRKWRLLPRPILRTLLAVVVGKEEQQRKRQKLVVVVVVSVLLHPLPMSGPQKLQRLRSLPLQDYWVRMEGISHSKKSRRSRKRKRVKLPRRKRRRKTQSLYLSLKLTTMVRALAVKAPLPNTRRNLKAKIAIPTVPVSATALLVRVVPPRWLTRVSLLGTSRYPRCKLLLCPNARGRRRQTQQLQGTREKMRRKRQPQGKKRHRLPPVRLCCITERIQTRVCMESLPRGALAAVL